MTTKWVVTTATDRIPLDEQRRGETAFTVTNPGRAADRAVFEVVPGTGAERSWFTVEDPQRLVRSSASVSYVMKVAVSPAAPPGTYEVKGRVYSSDAPPEEDFVDSNRVVLEVKPAPKPEPKKRPWWLIVVVALVVLVLGVVIWLVARGDEPAPPPAGDGTVPIVTGRTEAEATALLRDAGLKVGTVRHKHDAGKPEAVLEQSLPAGAKLPPDTAVNLVVQVRMSAPTVKAPANGTLFAPGAAAPTLEWEQAEAWPTKWHVLVQQEYCTVVTASVKLLCTYKNAVAVFVPAKSLKPPVDVVSRPTAGATGAYATGWVIWQVTPIDDFDNRGTPVTGVFQMRQS